MARTRTRACALMVSLGVVGALAGCSSSTGGSPVIGADSSPTATPSVGATASATPSPATSTGRPTTPPTAPTTPPATSAASAPAKYSGRGPAFLTVRKPEATSAALATISASGSGRFTVWTLDAKGKPRAALVDSDGAYHGNVLLGRTGSGTQRLQIRTIGWWSVVVKPILSARRTSSTVVRGSGDDVLVNLRGSVVVTMAHKGSGTFDVRFYGRSEKQLLSTTGSFSGTRAVPGSGTLRIKADGAWSVTETG